MRFGYTIVFLWLLQGCSLMKFNIQPPSEPMTADDMATRIVVRSYTESATNQIVAAADSMYRFTDNPLIQIESIRWKLYASNGITKAGYQTQSRAALTDVWIWTEQWRMFFDAKGDSIFFEQKEVAVDCMHELSEEIDQLAENLLTKDEYKFTHDFVTSYAELHPLKEFSSASPSALNDLISALPPGDSSLYTPVGTSAEVMNDFTVRMGRYQDQLQNSVDWQKEIALAQWDQNEMSEQFLARADTLAEMLRNLTVIAENSPEMMEDLAIAIQQELAPLVAQLNYGINTNIEDLSVERKELQIFLDEQRAVITKDIEEKGNEMIEHATDEMIRLVKSILWVVILLVVILFGVPFGLGYSFGRMRLKSKNKSKT